MTVQGKPYDLKLRTKRFAIEILQLVDELPKKKSTDIISYQLGRSASSVAANYRASSRAKTTKDFINKLKIVGEECDEAQFWLEALIEGKFHDEAKTQELHKEATELVAIIVKSIQTARANFNDKSA
jgi:four helix bundle protein